MKALLICCMLGTAAWADENAVDLPEMQPGNARFHAAMKAVADAESAKREKLQVEYLAALDVVFKQVAATGDLDATLQVKAEKERVEKNAESPGPAKATMPPGLRAAREKYERALAPLRAEQQNFENTVRQRYLAELDLLQKQLTMKTELEKALAVKAEKERISREIIPSQAGPAVPTAEGVDPATAFRMRGFFDKLKASAASPRVLKSMLGKRDRGKEFQDLPKDGAILVGFEITRGDWFGAPFIRSVQPIYLALSGKTRGEIHGNTGNDPTTIEARPGYAVGAISIHDGMFLWSLQVTFMKIDPLHRSLNVADSYQGDVYGDVEHHPDWKPTKKIAGDGAPLIGIIGWSGEEMNSLSVVQAP